MRYLSLHTNAPHPNALPLAARIAAPLAVGALLAAGCSSTSASSPYSGSAGGAPSSAASGGGSASAAAMVQSHAGPDGTYLTDSAGRTLYLFMADSGGASNCSG